MQHILTDEEYKALKYQADLGLKSAQEIEKIVKENLTEEDKEYETLYEREHRWRLDTEKRANYYCERENKQSIRASELLLKHHRLIDEVKKYQKLNWLKRMLTPLKIKEHLLKYEENKF